MELGYDMTPALPVQWEWEHPHTLPLHNKARIFLVALPWLLRYMFLHQATRLAKTSCAIRF